MTGRVGEFLFCPPVGVDCFFPLSEVAGGIWVSFMHLGFYSQSPRLTRTRAHLCTVNMPLEAWLGGGGSSVFRYLHGEFFSAHGYVPRMHWFLPSACQNTPPTGSLNSCVHRPGSSTALVSNKRPFPLPHICSNVQLGVPLCHQMSRDWRGWLHALSTMVFQHMVWAAHIGFDTLAKLRAIL